VAVPHRLLPRRGGIHLFQLALAGNGWEKVVPHPHLGLRLRPLWCVVGVAFFPGGQVSAWWGRPESDKPVRSGKTARGKKRRPGVAPRQDDMSDDLCLKTSFRATGRRGWPPPQAQPARGCGTTPFAVFAALSSLRAVPGKLLTVSISRSYPAPRSSEGPKQSHNGQRPPFRGPGGEALPRLVQGMFAFLLRNSSEPIEYFRLPRDMVVEIGRQFAIWSRHSGHRAPGRPVPPCRCRVAASELFVGLGVRLKVSADGASTVCSDPTWSVNDPTRTLHSTPRWTSV